MNKIIEINNLTLGYEKHKVINKINFDLFDNDFLCVVGENGSGKSTLIKGLLGIIKPMSGKIKFNDLKQNEIGYIPQDTSVDKHFPASVFEIVLSGTLNKVNFLSFYKKEQKEKAIEALKKLKISNLKDKSFSSLSGGQRQKVLIARALCATSKLLILDEPSNNLDYESRIELYDILKDINKDNNIAIIMITHDLDHSNLIGKHILSLKEDNFYYGTVDSYVKVIHHDR
jgi:zinc transport system ATP-binding protein